MTVKVWETRAIRVSDGEVVPLIFNNNGEVMAKDGAGNPFRAIEIAVVVNDVVVATAPVDAVLLGMVQKESVDDFLLAEAMAFAVSAGYEPTVSAAPVPVTEVSP